MNNPKTKYKFKDFPVGQKVKIVSDYVDCYFFYGETGYVIKNERKNLGIRVAFNMPREFEGGYIQYDFNFNPENLEPVGNIF